MKWLWTKIRWLMWTKARLWLWLVMGGGLLIGGQAVYDYATYDRIDAEITEVESLCEIRCTKVSETVRYTDFGPAQCSEISAVITRLNLRTCKARAAHYYALRFPDANDWPVTQRLAASKFTEVHQTGDKISVLRNPADSRSVQAPPGSAEYAVLGVGVALFGWLILRPILRMLGGSPSPQPAQTVWGKSTAKPKRPRKKRSSRYVQNGPIRSRRR